jgi:hypothetical protein
LTFPEDRTGPLPEPTTVRSPSQIKADRLGAKTFRYCDVRVAMVGAGKSAPRWLA